MYHSVHPLRLQGAPHGLEQLLGLVACTQIQPLSSGGRGFGVGWEWKPRATGCGCMSPNLGGTWEENIAV